MSPSLSPGTVVIGVGVRCLPRFLRMALVRPGRVVILRHQGLEKIKRVAEVSDRGLYVVGDNPRASSDSRQFGWLDADTMTAIVVWPWRARRR